MDDAAVLREAERRWGRPRDADLFARLMEQDARLVRAGWPPLTAWWQETMRRFYASGKRRFVARVGRKGTKSASCCRVAVNEVLNGNHVLRPGDLGLFVFLSENVKEAKSRIFTVRSILDALRVKWEPFEGDTRVVGTPLVFAVRAARVGAVSGPVVIGFVADEEAKWKDDDTGANPATEVLRSLRPATVTQPNAHEFHISSPWSDLDAHAAAFDEGDTPEQMVAEAPTWVANPTVSEAETHKLEPDEQTWEREYGARPMRSGTQLWFDRVVIDECASSSLVLPVAPPVGSHVSAGGDFAFVSDHAALVPAYRFGDWEKARYTVGGLYEMVPKGGPLKPGLVCGQFASWLKWHRCGAVMADGHYKMAIVEHLDEHSLAFQDAPSAVADPFVRARVLMNGHRVSIPKDARFLAQLKSVMWKPTPNGGISIVLPRKPGGGHCDLVSAYVLALWSRGGDEIEPQASTDQADIDRERLTSEWRQRKEDDADGVSWLERRFR